jgi:hypothetical protein
VVDDEASRRSERIEALTVRDAVDPEHDVFENRDLPRRPTS